MTGHTFTRLAAGLLAGWLAALPATTLATPQMRFSDTTVSESEAYVELDDLEKDTADSDFDCVIMPNEIVDISAGVSGRLNEVLVERGDEVFKDQLLAELESRVERASAILARERAAIDTQVRLRQTSLLYDRKMRERTATLYDRNVVATQERDQVEKEAELSGWLLRDAEDKKRLAELEYARALEILRLKSIYSPISGIVVERYKSPGEFVDEDPIVRVAQLDPLRVEAIVPVELYAQVSSAQAATIVAETEPGHVRNARVTLIDPMADPASGTFRVRLELPNADHRLLGGIKCKTRFADNTRPKSVDESLTDSEPVPQTQRGFHGLRPIFTPPSDTSGLASLPLSTEGVLRDAKSAQSKESVPESEPISAEQLLSEAKSIEKLVLKPAAANAGEPRLDSQPPSTQKLVEAKPSGPDPVATPDAENKLHQTGESNSAGLAFCQSFGPFESTLAAYQVIRDLSANKTLTTQIREAVVHQPNGFIVLATPRNENVWALEKRMRRLGVSDLLAMQYGPYEGRISLGTYLSEAPAENRRLALQALGIPVEVETRFKPAPVWWVDVQGAQAHAVEEMTPSIAPTTSALCVNDSRVGRGSVASVLD